MECAVNPHITTLEVKGPHTENEGVLVMCAAIIIIILSLIEKKVQNWRSIDIYK